MLVWKKSVEILVVREESEFLIALGDFDILYSSSKDFRELKKV